MGQLTEREKEILSLLRQDPMISQEELANRLNISRSATAVHISNMIKKGAILGRGYVFGEDPGIVVVGTTELTIAASTMEDPLDTGLPEGSITVSCGGAGFHLAKRLADADARVSLITAVSRDEYGDRALEDVQRAGANCQHSLRTSKLPTAKTIILEDAVGSLKRYVVERGAMQLLDPEYILAIQHVIARASVLLLDASLNADVLRTLLSIVKHANLQVILFLPEEGECVATLRNQVAADLDKIAIVAAAKDVGTQLKEPVQDTESCVRTAVKLLEAGGDTVLVWWKGQGAAVATSESAIFIPQLPVQEDLPYDLYSFGAAVAEARGRGFSWRQAVRKSLSAHPGRIVKTS